MTHNEKFRICPNFNYKRGVMFFKKVRGKTRIGLICPQCGSYYDIGWLTTNMKSLKGEKVRYFDG